ncbi:type II toxin-antitoxin system HicB family antitoxin [Streptococcus panodentis]|uniref:HicB-like antitoxin of toxin-antitoxin system domain-containing protein n=1 Tax=Streptococcus panodentis TaxID=1581472 RepID=A0ABS5ATJ0_9STRE|nr:type II toxin-antitoxin system HicB family antitoxin [Streptococcus panodentis]MBP2619880.1 hypothetical protein [Streptococcus panodentis]
MLITYPALFYYDDSEGEDVAPYFVWFPDIGGVGTQGRDISDAIFMASDYLGLMVADLIEKNQELPVPSNLKSLSLTENNPFKDDAEITLDFDPDKSFISFVNVDVAAYLGQQEPVKKTLTIPRWADKLGREMGLNFSQTLTDAIADKKLHA